MSFNENTRLSNNLTNKDFFFYILKNNNLTCKKFIFQK